MTNSGICPRGLALALACCLATPVGALNLVQRFGPDGLPFTHDDPLAVGGGASKARFGVMSGDACSEEEGLTGDFRSAHGHPDGGGHPSPGEVHTAPGLSAGKNHRPRPNPAVLAEDPEGNLVLEAPFDWTVFVSAMSLADGQMTRTRAFPTDDHWTANDQEKNFVSPLQPKFNRGWIDGWNGGEGKMDRVWQPGPPVKDLHIDTLGLSYRDVKPKDGWSAGIHWETLDNFEFKNKDRFDEGYGARLDLLNQQSYIEGWVAELVNLNNHETGISGNFLVDVAGSQPMGRMGFNETSMLCTFIIRDLPIELGAPAGVLAPNLTFVQTALQAGVFPHYPPDKSQFDYVWSNADMSGLCAMFPGIAKTVGKGKVAARMAKLDRITAFVKDDDYLNIGTYSGLAGRDKKNPGDKLALGLLEHSGQFKPKSWLRWIYLGDNPAAAIGFQAQGKNAETLQGLLEPVVTESTTEVMNDQNGWRYNSGSTYMSKAGMIFGASDARRKQPLPAEVPLEDKKRTPDLLESFAKKWLYVRMDVVDPLELSEREEGGAVWREFDALIAHPSKTGPGKAGARVDWPPPNFGFGRAQVSSFRSASGGTPLPGGGITADEAMQFQALFSIDPVTMTYSVCGAGLPSGSGQAISFGGYQKRGGAAYLGWTRPRPLPDLDTLTAESGRRWLTAAANHYKDAGTELRWMWDFERDNRIDSEHAQHMSDVKGAETGAVSAVQAEAAGGGRTGFAFVPMNGSTP